MLGKNNYFFKYSRILTRKVKLLASFFTVTLVKRVKKCVNRLLKSKLMCVERNFLHRKKCSCKKILHSHDAILVVPGSTKCMPGLISFKNIIFFLPLFILKTFLFLISSRKIYFKICTTQ